MKLLIIVECFYTYNNDKIKNIRNTEIKIHVNLEFIHPSKYLFILGLKTNISKKKKYNLRSIFK